MTKKEIKQLFPAKYYQNSCDIAAKRLQCRTWTLNGRSVSFSGIGNEGNNLHAVFTYIGDNNNGTVELSRYRIELGDALDTITGNITF